MITALGLSAQPPSLLERYYNQDFLLSSRSARSDCGYFGIRRRDAGGEREQRCGPSGQAEEEVPQPVDPPDQQHGAGPLRSAEGHAGGTGDCCFITGGIKKEKVKRGSLL